MTHICVDKLSIIGSDNDLFWTNAGILLIVPLGTNFSGILIGIQTYSLKKIRLKMSSAKCCPFRLGLNELSKIQKKMCNTLCLSKHRSGVGWHAYIYGGYRKDLGMIVKQFPINLQVLVDLHMASSRQIHHPLLHFSDQSLFFYNKPMRIRNIYLNAN